MAAPAVLASLCLAAVASAAAPGLRKPARLTRELLGKFHGVDRQRQNVSWHVVPARIVREATREAANRTLPEVRCGSPQGGRTPCCGERIPASALGLKRSASAAGFFKNAALVQAGEHPGRDSLAVPGVGVEQTTKDEGTSAGGTVGGQEPFVTALKDGFSLVGCYTDAMLEYGDKFGNNKDKYNMAGKYNVSIALYSELILKAEQKPMTPTVCYEFCRTLPGMVYFGITAGKDCYCTPFYKPMPADGQQCDQVCAGDPTNMCGNMKGKSSMWEMHLCADTAQDLAKAGIEAKEALDFFFENALLASDLGEKMDAAGEKLKTAGGLAGSATAAANAMAVSVKSKALTQAYMAGVKAYTTLLKAYKETVEMEDAVFLDAGLVTQAEHTIATIKATKGEVLAAAVDIHAKNQEAYPLSDSAIFGGDPDSADSVATMLAKLLAAKKSAADTFKNPNFRDAAYSTGRITWMPEASTCAGPIIGAPILGMGLAGCQAACEATVSPKSCVAFSLYYVDGESDVCLLLEDVAAMEAYGCQGEARSKGFPAGAKCQIKMSAVATGYKPKDDLKVTPRCFSTMKNQGVKASMEILSKPEGTEVKVASGASIEKAL